MEFKGWLLEPHISGKHAVLWFKTIEGKVIRVRERYYPKFTVEAKQGFTPDNVRYLFEEHPDVHSAKIVKRYPSLHRRTLKQFVEVNVHTIGSFKKLLRYAEKLPEVKEVYNTGLIPIQWYMIYKGIAPSNLCLVEDSEGELKKISVIEDADNIAPPPFKTIIFEASDSQHYNIDGCRWFSLLPSQR